MFPNAVEFARCQNGLRTLLQRKLKLGYARRKAHGTNSRARYHRSRSRGSKPRQVLITKQQWMEKMCHVGCSRRLTEIGGNYSRQKKRLRRTEQAHEDNRHRSLCDSRRAADNLRALYESPFDIPTWGELLSDNEQTIQSGDALNQPFTVHAIDVGQGDSILVKSGDHAMLIDAGERGNDQTILDYLKANSVEKLDYIVATTPIPTISAVCQGHRGDKGR